MKLVQNLPVRQWNKTEKEWRVPRLASKSLEQLDQVIWTDKAKLAKQNVEATILKLVDLKFQEGESDGLLRPYQTVGVEFLTFAKKGLLADDMGLGKSIQAIKAALDVSANKVLVLCPASLKWKWADEFKKHFNIDAFVVSGTKNERRAVWKSNAKYRKDGTLKKVVTKDHPDCDDCENYKSTIKFDKEGHIKSAKNNKTKNKHKKSTQRLSRAKWIKRDMTPYEDLAGESW